MTHDQGSFPGADTQQTAASKPPPFQNYTDGYSYEVPRPFLTLSQASSLLGMTLRSLERSLLGRWGNKLPEGWLARKIKTEKGEEWRILPPPGFRVKVAGATTGDTERLEGDNEMDPEQQTQPTQAAGSFAPPPSGDPQGYYTANRRKQPPWRPDRHTLEQPTIVIDRSEEIEHLLKELVAAKSALAEERRLHLEDLRVISQLQGSLRLLEAHTAEQSRVKTELEAAKTELAEWKEKYNQLVNKSWWRKLLGK